MIIRYHSEARKELFATAQYYEEQVVGIGDEFILEVQNVLDLIKEFPTVGTQITSSERWVLVMDLRRKPNYWKSRR
jgi:hypothetical protein